MRKGAQIGCGYFAQNQLHGWAGLPNVQIVALCDNDPARSAQTAARFEIGRTCTDVQAMLAAGRRDFVDIATKVSSHRTADSNTI